MLGLKRPRSRKRLPRSRRPLPSPLLGQAWRARHGGSPDPYPLHLKELIDCYLKSLTFTREPGTEEIERAIRYALFPGGKRVRPVLTLATAEAVGMGAETVLPTAAAIELVHTNSLIADDLPPMDDHGMRRGKRALHRVFGEDIALLAGVVLSAESFRLILEQQPGPTDRVRAVALELVAATGTGGMAGGQYFDVKLNGGIDVAKIQRMHELKTGSLIEAAVSCVLELSAPPDSVAASLRRFARSFGLMFQIVDDVVDVTAPSKVLGRRPRSDARMGKHTYVSQLGLRRARELAREAYAEARHALAQADRATSRSTAALAALAACAYARAK